MEYFDFLQRDPMDDDNARDIASYTISHLEQMREKDFDANLLHRFPGIMHKFIDMAESRGCACETTSASIEPFMKEWTSNANYSASTRRSAVLSSFEKVYSSVIKVFFTLNRGLTQDTSFSEFVLFYNPGLADKPTASKLITEAIHLVETDTTLPKGQKKQIVQALLKALQILNSDSPDWTRYFGTLAQVLNVLAAVGSIVGGVTGVLQLDQALQKVAEANTIVAETSVKPITFLPLLKASDVPVMGLPTPSALPYKNQ